MDNREIDRLIAEKVMGFKVITATKEAPAIVGGSCVSWGTWIETGRRLENWGIEKLNVPDVLEIKNYSHNIAAAWEVVMKMQHRGFWAQLRTPFDKADVGSFYWCGFTPHLTTGRPDYYTSAETMQLAICLAALKTIDGKPEDL